MGCSIETTAPTKKVPMPSSMNLPTTHLAEQPDPTDAVSDVTAAWTVHVIADRDDADAVIHHRRRLAPLRRLSTLMTAATKTEDKNDPAR